jgi:hypothetical protein
LKKDIDFPEYFSVDAVSLIDSLLKITPHESYIADLEAKLYRLMCGSVLKKLSTLGVSSSNDESVPAKSLMSGTLHYYMNFTDFCVFNINTSLTILY